MSLLLAYSCRRTGLVLRVENTIEEERRLALCGYYSGEQR
jgi:hypothetical protein